VRSRSAGQWPTVLDSISRRSEIPRGLSAGENDERRQGTGSDPTVIMTVTIIPPRTATGNIAHGTANLQVRRAR
jgi:hypothetical protein